jgi:hypothetical protein
MTVRTGARSGRVVIAMRVRVRVRGVDDGGQLRS